MLYEAIMEVATARACLRVGRCRGTEKLFKLPFWNVTWKRLSGFVAEKFEGDFGRFAGYQISGASRGLPQYSLLPHSTWLVEHILNKGKRLCERTVVA